jgi:hypothetical protein
MNDPQKLSGFGIALTFELEKDVEIIIPVINGKFDISKFHSDQFILVDPGPVL